MPLSSADTIAPWTGETEPTADKIGAQSTSLTVALATVVGGNLCGAEIILWNWSALRSARRDKKSARTDKNRSSQLRFLRRNTIESSPGKTSATS